MTKNESTYHNEAQKGIQLYVTEVIYSESLCCVSEGALVPDYYSFHVVEWNLLGFFCFVFAVFKDCLLIGCMGTHAHMCRQSPVITDCWWNTCWTLEL